MVDLSMDGVPVKPVEDVRSDEHFTYSGGDASVFKVGLLLRMEAGHGFIYGRITKVDAYGDDVVVYFTREEQ